MITLMFGRFQGTAFYMLSVAGTHVLKVPVTYCTGYAYQKKVPSSGAYRIAWPMPSSSGNTRMNPSG